MQTTFALADLGDTAHPIGIAGDWRVVLHELGGHGILYQHVHSANFGFAHSAGDSFAAILNDPGTQAPDRFLTFPWVNIGRRHDRPVGGGWAWGGVNDVGGYSTEQILSTTQFRLYRSIGGDAALRRLGSRQFAARITAYLILRAVGSLTPATNPAERGGLRQGAARDADLGDWTTEGHIGGAYRKVIRWAFEKQGLFQPPGAPTPVDHGRARRRPSTSTSTTAAHGEYQYQPVSLGLPEHLEPPARGRRHGAPGPGGRRHQLRVRADQEPRHAAGDNVVVKAYHAHPAAGLVYPNDWKPMTTPQLPAPTSPPNNAVGVMVGPFEWTPSAGRARVHVHDRLRDRRPEQRRQHPPGESIPEWRLVPHDNNIGQRNVTPIAFIKIDELIKAFSELRFTLKNPLRVSAKMLLSPKLPKTLTSRKWKLEFTNAGEATPKLGAGKTIPITMKLVPGEPFTAADLAKEKSPAIRIEAYATGSSSAA